MDNLDLKNNHMTHGVIIAGILYLLTKSIPVSAAGGIGAGLYMTKYGHGLPIMTQRKPDHKVPTPHSHLDQREHHDHNHSFNPLHRSLVL